MKTQKVILFALLLSLPLGLFAQDKAIGLRLGAGAYTGAEISYQTPFMGERLEANLGLAAGDGYSSAAVTAVYQWLFPIENGFNWYAGFGPGVAIGSYKNANGDFESKFNLGVAGNLGIEYNFDQVPLQLSLDTRPMFNLLYDSTGSLLYFGLGIRYKF